MKKREFDFINHLIKREIERQDNKWGENRNIHQVKRYG